MFKKRLGCIILTVAMVLTVIQGCFITVYSDSAPTLIVDDIKTLTRYGSGYFDTSNSLKIDVNDEEAPVTQAYQYVCTQAGSSSLTSGVRSNSGFEVSESNTYVVVAYWVKATLDETVEEGIKPVVCANLRYVNAASSSGTYIDKTGDIILPKENVWYRCMRVIKIPDATTGAETSDKSLIRFELGASAVAGQTTLVGGYSVYSFGTAFSYGGETETEAAIKAYIKDNKLSTILNDGIEISGFDPTITKYIVEEGTLGTIAATANQSIYSEQIISQSSQNPKTAVITVKTYDPDVISEQSASLDMVYTINEPDLGESALTDDYSYDSWTMAGVDYRGAAVPLKVTEDGRTAMKFWGNDSAFTDNGSGSQYRGQLAASYLVNNADWQDGDKFYISFYAKGHSNYGNATPLSITIQGVTSAGGGGTVLAKKDDISLTDSWKKYSMVFTLSNRKDTDVNVRVCLNIGYKGQVTYLSDFKMYKLENDLSDAYILNYYDGKVCENISKTTEIYYAGLSTYGHCDTEEIADTSLPFTTAKKYYSDAENYSVTNSINAYRARKQTTAIIQDNLAAGDKIMLIYWAKGSVDENVAEGQTSAKIRPLLQKDASGSNAGSIYQLTADGATDTSEISVTDQWQRYVSIFELPDMGENELRFEWQLGYKGQTVYLADAQIYNLGQISVAEAFSKIGITDLDGYYRTRKMNLSDSTFTADVEYSGNYSFENVTVDGNYPFVEYVKTDDSIKAIAPDGTERIYTVVQNQLDHVNAEEPVYSQNEVGGIKVILKFDDLRASDTHIAAFQKIVNFADEHPEYNLKMNFGLIGFDWDNLTYEDAKWNIIKGWQDSGNVEIWHHGYYHDSGNTKGYGDDNYQTDSYEDQKANFAKTYDLLTSHGINVYSFGPPYNKISETTFSMLQTEYPSIKSVMRSNVSSQTYTELTYLNNWIDLETTAGVTDFNNFVVNYNNASKKDYFVIQMHPYSWFTASDGNDYFAEFVKAIEFLYQQGAEFMLEKDYVDIVNGEAADTTKISNIASVKLRSGTETGAKAYVIYAVYKTDASENNVLVDCNFTYVDLPAFESVDAKASVMIPKENAPYTTKLFVWRDLESLISETNAFSGTITK